jgi:hypothetical protein
MLTRSATLNLDVGIVLLTLKNHSGDDWQCQRVND